MKQSEFKKFAEKHQIGYKEERFGSTCDKFYKHKENGKLILDKSRPIRYYLTDTNGKEGENYYKDKDFDILQAVYNRFPDGFYYKRDSNMLRSEHIPFNLFVPLIKNKDFCKQIFNEILNNVILSIDSIKIEYAPSPKENYLNDGTSFDTYIEYTHIDNSMGIICIEVKYTEREYPLVKFEKDKKTGERKLTKAWQDIEDYKNKKGIYYDVTKKRKLYKDDYLISLVEDKFRQIWRNHLLAESILLNDNVKHAYSLIFYPKDNSHFEEVGKEYVNMLVDDKKSTFGLVTYESFIDICRKFQPNKDYEDWINYLQNRYIIK